jgi:hypothetical protein
MIDRMSIGMNDSNNNQTSFTPLIASHGFSPSRAPKPFQVEVVGGGEGGFPILPVILITGSVAALIFALANQMLSKTKKKSNISPDNSEVIKEAVNTFKLSNPDKADSISYTNSCVMGGFIAIKTFDGQLLAEIPLSKVA